MLKRTIVKRTSVPLEMALKAICNLLKDNYVEYTVMENVITSTYIPIVLSTIDKRFHLKGKTMAINPFICISKITITLPTQPGGEMNIQIDITRSIYTVLFFIFTGLLVLIADPRIAIFFLIAVIFVYQYEVNHLVLGHIPQYINEALNKEL